MIASQAIPSRSAEPVEPTVTGAIAPEATTARSGAQATDVVVALAQLAPRLGDVDANLTSHLAAIAEAKRMGANLVVFPELSLTGYFVKDLVPDVALRLNSDEINTLRAASFGIDVLVGLVLESEDARFFNAALYCANGEVAHVHRKVYLPTYGLFDESRYFAAGDRFRAFSAPLASASPPRSWRAGVLICEDLWHPSAPTILARDGVDAIICPSSSPARGVGRGYALGSANSYEVMTKTYAQLFTSYVLHCNRVGYEDGVAFWGGSRVVAPDGAVLAGPAGRSQEIVSCRLDLGAIRRARIANPLLRDERHDVNDSETDRLRQRRTRD